MTERCGQCGGRFDRPGLYGCSFSHPEPDAAQRIVAAIEEDLSERRGLSLDGVDEDIQDEIRDTWTKLIYGVIGEPAA